jgi:hypothetical protein
VDVDKLSTGEKVSAVSAVLLFIFMFFDWFSVEVSGGNGILSASAGGSAWDALDYIPIFLVITIVAAIGVAVVRLTETPFEPAISVNAVIAVLGGISFLLILYRIVDAPGAGTFPGVSVDVSPAVGIFLGLIAAAGIAYGGYRAMQEEGSSFADVGDRLSGAGPAPRGGSATTPPPPPPSSAAPAPPPPPAAPPERPPGGGGPAA